MAFAPSTFVKLDLPMHGGEPCQNVSLPEELWQELEPLLPPDEVPGCKGGRPRVLSKTAMTGIYFVLCVPGFAGRTCLKGLAVAE